MESKAAGKAAWIAVAIVFAAAAASTFISYKPYEFTWDDSDYLLRAMSVNRAFWSGDAHGVGAAMVSWHTPVMTLMALPWRYFSNQDAAGDCFVTLAALTALLAASCFYLLLRIGVRPICLLVASVCVGGSLGPYQAGQHAIHMHELATRFLSDNLFAWAALVAVLLVPFEARNPDPSARNAVLRGILCGLICSLGALTKVSFFYFIGLVVPLLLVIRFRGAGLRSTLAWAIAFAGAIAPTAIYFLRYGRSAVAQGGAASFGGLADFYHVPLRQFLAENILESPGLIVSLLLLAGAGLYLAVKKRPGLFDSDFIALLIMIGFLFVVLAASSRQVRYLFPAIVALPFLLSILLSKKESSVRPRLAGWITGVVFIVLVFALMPLRHRTYQQSLASAEAVLDEASRCNAKNVLLATDSPSLNIFLLNLTSVLSSSQTAIQTLAYQAMSGAPIQNDFAEIKTSDLVVFQDAARLRPKFTNQRVPDYERYVRSATSTSIRVGDDTTVYTKHCNPGNPTAASASDRLACAPNCPK